jgi:hypothetical protein
MTPVQARSINFFSLLLMIFILTSGCISDVKLPPSDQYDTNIATVSITPLPTIEKTLSIEQASEIIKTFIMPLKIDNLTYLKTIIKSNTTLFEFSSDTASFVVNPTTGRVQSAKWTGSGPVIPGISPDINQSCEQVGEFAKEKYPEIWVSGDTRGMDEKVATIWPLDYNIYECTWYETLYYPDKKTKPHFTISDRNSVDIVIDPSTGIIQSYEETFIPLRSDLDLQSKLTEDRAWEFAKQYFEKKGVINIQPSEQTNYGLYISTSEEGRQYLVYALMVDQSRNMGYGGLIGIDAHDGHVVYYGSF